MPHPFPRNTAPESARQVEFGQRREEPPPRRREVEKIDQRLLWESELDARVRKLSLAKISIVTLDVGRLGTALVLGAVSCASVPKPGSRASDWGYDVLTAQVEFDYGCPAQKIRLIRYDGHRAVDLDVCGVVRRYKSFGGEEAGKTPTLVDVTRLYPADALPKPLPPESAAPATPPAPPGEPARCKSSNDCLIGVCIDGICRR